MYKKQSTYSVPGIDPDTDLKTLDPDAGEYLYSRLSNPTWNALGRRLAALEGADHALVLVSGTAATAVTMTAAVRPDDHIVVLEDPYGETRTMLTWLFADRLNVDVSSADTTDPENVAVVMREETAFVWTGTPTSPLMHLCDIKTIAAIADEGDVVLGTGNTFPSPQLQAPLSLGADVVVHSTTKYLSGHSNSIGGMVVTDRKGIPKELTFLQHVGMGSALSLFDSYLTLRGTKALPLWMHQHKTNAMETAEFLDPHETVTRMPYPGLESYLQHDLVARQQPGFGGVLSFEPDTDPDGTAKFLGALQEFPLAVSLDDTESLIERPTTMTHSPFSQTERDALDISGSLSWPSVGVEHVSGLRSDLASALSVL